MTTTLPQMSPTNLAALDQAVTRSTSEAEAEASVSPVVARILEAFAVAQAHCEQIPDPTHKQNLTDRLLRSDVRGSKVRDIRGADEVVTMLSSVSGWEEKITNLKDDSITVFEGELPQSYDAIAAYATVREIGNKFGPQGLGTVQAKIGYQKPDEFYFCTTIPFPTHRLSVQLKMDPSGTEHLLRWFAGVELSSRTFKGDGDVIVRCNVKFQELDNAHKQPRMHRKGYANSGFRGTRNG